MASRCSVPAARSRPTISPGACARSTAPTTTCCPPEWGAADNQFPEGFGTDFRTIMVPIRPGRRCWCLSPTRPASDNDGPGSAGPGDVFDPYVRTISNLIVDQTLGNPSAILTALQRAGIVAPANQMAVTAQITAAYEPLRPLFNAWRTPSAPMRRPGRSLGQPGQRSSAGMRPPMQLAAVAAARGRLDTHDDCPLDLLLEANGIELDGANVVITNAAPDEGLSAPFNSWFTLFGQFFDHGLDLVDKGGNGTVFIPLMPDDPLYVAGQPRPTSWC